MTENPAPVIALVEQLRARADTYERVVGECHADLVKADQENTAAGAVTHFAEDPCPTCEESRVVIPLLRQAADLLASLGRRIGELETELLGGEGSV